MNFAGFACTSPLSCAALVDQLRWRVVVYADTPRAQANFQQEVAKTSDKKLVCFVLGAHLINKVLPHKAKIASIFVFDDIVNLQSVKEQVPNFPLVDVVVEDGQRLPKAPTPQDISDALTNNKTAVSEQLFLRVAQVLTQRAPSVLETTNRMPQPAPMQVVSGIQGLMMELKSVIDGNPAEKVAFPVCLDYLCRLAFGMVRRTTVTANVTKRLSPEAAVVWAEVLAIVCSPVGERMSCAFKALCEEPEARVHTVAHRTGLVPSLGDFVYLTAAFPPSPSHVFLPSSFEENGDFSGAVNVSSTPPASVKTKEKKARRKA